MRDLSCNHVSSGPDNIGTFKKGTYPTVKKIFKKFIPDRDNQTFAFIGKGVLPFIANIKLGEISWKGKNVPNDYLDLQVPIDDVDGCFFKNNASLAVANADNKIRIFDVRSKCRKPVQDQQLTGISEKARLSTMKILKSNTENKKEEIRKVLYEATERNKLSKITEYICRVALQYLKSSS